MFTSWANNLVPHDTNGTYDVFVRDLQTGASSRANVASDGSQANGSAVASSISDDGRFVAFFSHATNLVVRDTNGAVDAFVHDFQTGETDRVSVAFDGSQADQGGSQPSVSDDGHFVAFESGSGLVPRCGTGQVFIRDRQAGTTICATLAPEGSGANNFSFDPSVSADGRFVAFYSPASNLVGAGLDTNGTDDIFVRDRDADADGIFDEVGAVSTTRASVDSAGGEANGRSSGASIRGDGRFVAFVSDASNLVGRDTNGVGDAFVHECLPDGTCGAPPPCEPLVADAGPDQSVRSGEFAHLDGSSSSCRDLVTSFSRDFGDGQTGEGESVTHRFSKPQVYQVTLTVFDSLGRSASDVALVTVNPLTSTAAFSKPDIFGFAHAASATATYFWLADTADGSEYLVTRIDYHSEGVWFADVYILPNAARLVELPSGLCFRTTRRLWDEHVISLLGGTVDRSWETSIRVRDINALVVSGSWTPTGVGPTAHS